MNTKNQIELELRKYYDAFNEKDWLKFSESLDDNFKYFTDKCTVQSKQEFLEFLKRNIWCGAGYKISDLNFIISDNEDLAIASYSVEFTGTVSGENMTVRAIETTVFIKLNDKWKIIHSHSSNK